MDIAVKFVRQQYVGWLGIMIDRTVYNGAVIFDATYSSEAQLNEVVKPIEKDVRQLLYELQKHYPEERLVISLVSNYIERNFRNDSTYRMGFQR